MQIVAPVSATAAAIAAGGQLLTIAATRPSSGSATATGLARDRTGRDWPARLIRAGDTITFVDTSDQTSHYVLSTSYEHESLQTRLTFGALRTEWIVFSGGWAWRLRDQPGLRSAALPWVDHPDCLGLPVGPVRRPIDIDIDAIAHRERGSRDGQGRIHDIIRPVHVVTAPRVPVVAGAVDAA